MRIYYIICSFLATVINILLIFLFRPLRQRLRGAAWFCIIAAFFMVLVNNLIISFLIVEQPSRFVATMLLILFFAIKPIKNMLWLAGFWAQYRDFVKLENIEKELAKYISSDKNKVIKEDETFSESLVNDLESSKK